MREFPSPITKCPSNILFFQNMLGFGLFKQNSFAPIFLLVSMVLCSAKCERPSWPLLPPSFLQFLYSRCILLPFHFVFRSSRAAATGKGEGRLFLATTDHRPLTPVMMKQSQKLRKEEAEDRRTRDISLGPHIHSFLGREWRGEMGTHKTTYGRVQCSQPARRWPLSQGIA
jgi:hypothetical protein